jgi:hypothetical protein
MLVTPSDLENLVRTVREPEKNSLYRGFYAAILRVCEALESSLVVTDDADRTAWLVDMEGLRLWAVEAPNPRNPLAGMGRLDALDRLVSAAKKWWRGPSTGPVRPLRFVKDPVLRTIAERDLHSLGAATKAEETKAALIFSGSVIEAVLLDVLERDAVLTATAAARHPQPNRVRGQPRGWDFEPMIDVCGPSGLAVLAATTVTISHTVRRWRNFVHPDRERTELAAGPLGLSDAHLSHALTQKILEEAETWCAAHP